LSWYEAAAYCEFRGKSLPCVYHWVQAANVWGAEWLIPASNMEGTGLAPVGSFPGAVSYPGVYDMAGNAREWCYNATEQGRFNLGGSWNDAVYCFTRGRVRRPFDRAPENGVRCIGLLSSEDATGELWDPLPERPLEPSGWANVEPFSDEVFGTYLNFVSYGDIPLEDTIELIDDSSPYWRMEKASFAAAYDGERMAAYVFLPRNVKPPFQTVLYLPGAGATYRSSSGNGRNLTDRDKWEFFVRGGRAVIHPILKWDYERGGGRLRERKPIPSQDQVVTIGRDIIRALDYLESRDDLDAEKIAYCGFSRGGNQGIAVSAFEQRIKTTILISGGLNNAFTYNCARRITIPVLMVYGRYDFRNSYESEQLPLYNALATPPEHKRHIVFESYHSLTDHHNEMVREVLAWLDKYLGPVERAAQ
jgi:dienelactone hydrolase